MTLDNYFNFGDEYPLFNMPLSPLPKVVSNILVYFKILSAAWGFLVASQSIAYQAGTSLLKIPEVCNTYIEYAYVFILYMCDYTCVSFCLFFSFFLFFFLSQLCFSSCLSWKKFLEIIIVKPFFSFTPRYSLLYATKLSPPFSACVCVCVGAYRVLCDLLFCNSICLFND